MTKSAALKILSEGKHRITRTREVLLDHILGAKRPFSAPDLHRALADQSVDLVTIYRNLDVFAAAGLICRADFSDESARYTVAHRGHRHHHHHVVCRACGRVSAIEGCGLAKQETAVRALGFSAIEHRLEFSGLCARCAHDP